MHVLSGWRSVAEHRVPVEGILLMTRRVPPAGLQLVDAGIDRS